MVTGHVVSIVRLKHEQWSVYGCGGGRGKSTLYDWNFVNDLHRYITFPTLMFHNWSFNLSPPHTHTHTCNHTHTRTCLHPCILGIVIIVDVTCLRVKPFSFVFLRVCIEMVQRNIFSHKICAQLETPFVVVFFLKVVFVCASQKQTLFVFSIIND